jgi:hypothetical protein
MSGMNHNRLAARVRALNEVNAVANQYEQQLIDAFRPFLGREVLKADGNLRVDVQRNLPPAPKGVRVWRKSERMYTVL